MQVTNGILSILSSPSVFNFFQNTVGANKVRQTLVTTYITPKGGDKILDVGCGTGEILKYLPKDVDYHGYDLSPRYIEHATQKYGKVGKFYCADASSLVLKADEKFDRVLALSLLHHLEDEEVSRLFKFIKTILKPGGYLITQDICYTEKQSKLSRYITSRDRGRNVRTTKGYQDLAEQSFNNIQIDIRDDLFRIPLTNTIMSCY